MSLNHNTIRNVQFINSLVYFYYCFYNITFPLKHVCKKFKKNKYITSF